MIKNYANTKINVRLAIGVPVMLLLLSVVFINNDQNNIVEKGLNKYLKQMPAKYGRALENCKANDSTYFSTVIEDYATRELVVFKSFPDHMEAAKDFEVKLYPVNNKPNQNEKTFIEFNIVSNAAIYNFKGKTYGVFKRALPFIDIEKISLEKKILNKREKRWRDTINNPFSTLEKAFSYAQLGAKTFQTKPNVYTTVFIKALEEEGISSLPYSYAINGDSLFQTTTTLNNYITGENETIGTIENPNKFWKNINNKTQFLSKNITFIGENSEKAKELITHYSNQELELKDIIDIKKLASFIALKNVFSNSCNEKLHFLYNKESSLLEPFFLGSECLGKRAKYILKSKIENPRFVGFYINELDKVSKIEFYDDFVKTNLSFQNEISFINRYYPENVYDVDLININKKVVAKSLNISSLLKIELISIDENRLIVSAFNFSSYPVKLKNLKYKKNKTITSLNFEKEILSGKRDTFTIDLPRSFENLFVSKKKKATGFVLYKHIYDLYFGYSVSGTEETFFSPIIPYQTKEEIGEDLFRKKNVINNHKDILVNKSKGIITFTKKTIVVSSPLIIPKGFTFTLKPGTTIDVLDGGKIVSHSPLNFIGTKQKPIKIFSSDKKGQGIIVLSEGKKSELKHVAFDNLTNLQHGNWNVTGAVTFYESPVNLNYVEVSNNRCEDALNIVRTTFDMRNCTISNTQSDAFDGDFVTGTIRASKFINLGNDAIDVSGSELKISNLQISNAGDKGLSAGENSKMFVDNITISLSEIAIASKDLSIIEGKNIKIKNTKLGITAFQKKPEFGPSSLIMDDVEMDLVETKYLIENTSSLKIDGRKIETAQNVKDRMYGVEFGVSSKETRKANK